MPPLELHGDVAPGGNARADPRRRSRPQGPVLHTVGRHTPESEPRDPSRARPVRVRAPDRDARWACRPARARERRGPLRRGEVDGGSRRRPCGEGRNRGRLRTDRPSRVRRAVEHGRKHLTLFHKANNLKLTEGMLLDGSASSAITTRAGSFSKWFARSERLERRPPTSAGQPAPRRSLPMSSSGSLAM